MVKGMKKKGESGAAKNYISRNAAIKKLQVTLADFRRLCILKGIYPREPRNKKKANKGSTAPTTFYYSKDIAYLFHEPVINKFREHKVFARKLAKALGKEEYGTAKRLDENRPMYTLDHIVKERYPTFLDALRDLDDALSMLFLFATMPTAHNIDAKVIQNCDRLCREFEHYVIQSKSLRKVFLSIKGIYYQAEIKGQDVTWLVPYKFSQNVPTDVDFRIMLTFLEFHQTFVGFINYRLFTELGLVYPPKIDTELDDQAAGLGAFNIRKIGLDNDTDAPAPKNTQKQIASLDLAQISNGPDEEEMPIDDAIEPEAELDDFTNIAGDNDNDQVALHASAPTTSLFAKFHFFLAREVPRYSLEFVIRAFGGQVSWDPILGGGSPLLESDPAITHHVCDRPNQEKKYQGRIYLQPQWVYDCINKGKLERLDLYATGATLPPHLSPFVKVEDGDYDPNEPMEEEEEDVEVTEDLPEQVEAAQAQSELEAESKGIKFSDFKAKPVPKAVPEDVRISEEAAELAKMMMSNRDKKIYTSMKRKSEKQEQTTDALRKRRRELSKK